jgi:hypothetical protein
MLKAQNGSARCGEPALLRPVICTECSAGGADGLGDSRVGALRSKIVARTASQPRTTPRFCRGLQLTRKLIAVAQRTMSRDLRRSNQPEDCPLSVRLPVQTERSVVDNACALKGSVHAACSADLTWSHLCPSTAKKAWLARAPQWHRSTNVAVS